MINPNPIVFIVDDDPSVRKGLERLLKSNGYTVESFVSAQEFLETDTICEGPACLVLDIKMPGLTGIDLQREMLKREYAMPVVFITGHGNIPTSVKAMKEGAVDFLTKPFDQNDLLNAVKEAIRKDIENRKAIDNRQRIHQKIKALTPREYEILARQKDCLLVRSRRK